MVFYAPHYLVYTESKLRSDGIILLLNPDLEASKKEVYRLITVLYSSHLIIPVYGKVLKARDSGALPPMKRRPSIQYSSTREKKDKHNYRVYEDTDMEVMHAKAIMVRFGFKSADFLSSPYRIRRRKLIARRVFDGGFYDLSFVPNRYMENCDLCG